MDVELEGCLYIHPTIRLLFPGTIISINVDSNSPGEGAIHFKSLLIIYCSEFLI